MPGFMIHGEGAGPNSLAEVRRTHRWEFESLGPGNLLAREVRLVLKTASRPSLTFEEPPMHHNQEQVYFAGKHTWEALALSWYDVEQEPDVSAEMFKWLEKCMSLTGGNAAAVNVPNTYKATESRLSMQDGLGSSTEVWGIYNGWPQQINWGGLDYSSSDLQLIEVKFRFDRAAQM